MMKAMMRLFTALAVGLMAAPLWAQDIFADIGIDPAFYDAVQALEAGDVETAQNIVAASDPLTRDLFAWMQFRAGEGTFAEMAAFVQARPTWPGLSSIREQAEGLIDADPPSTLLAFFQDGTVETGEGAVAYANALIATGNTDAAHAMLVELWHNTALSPSGHQAIINTFPDVVAPHHAARTDMLLWRWRTSDVALMLPLLDEGQQTLARARAAIISRASDANALEGLMPERLRGDAGLHYDRFNWYADRGDWTQAIAILLDRSRDAETLGQAWRWGSWRRILARWQMREGEVERAYTMAANHFIAPDEDNYDDLEWLAGYIALTYQKDYALALAHFDRFDAAVSSPISKGRAGYWRGRAYEGLGDAEAAIAAFQDGAQHQTSFYGLLAAEKLGLSMDPDVIGGETFGDWRTGTATDNDLVRAGLTLLAADERGLAVLFLRDAAAAMGRRDIGQLGALMMELDEPFYAVLIAKTAVANGLIVQDVYFPLHPMAQLDLPVDPALALAIARQESEFRIDAGSSVGALGMMQLMPATAEEVAGWLDMPYSRARLITDWEYNTALGAEYLAFLTREFGAAPVMIAAGYNAGPSRPRAWVSERGDPRAGFANADPVDIIDWIEHIPFRETRNYVMRVTEGLAVYRARLSGRIEPVRFSDMLIGQLPVIRPVARRAASLVPTVPQPMRPVARAGN